MKIKTSVLRQLYFAFFLNVSFLLAYTGLVFAEEKIVAIVNKEAITKKDLDDFISVARVELSNEFQGEELENKIKGLKTEILDRLIEERLIVQEASKFIEDAKGKKDVYAVMRVEPEESRVKNRIEEIKKKYNSSIEFQRDLEAHGLVQADLEKRIREQMLILNFIDYKIRSKIIVRPDEVTTFYKQNHQNFLTPIIRQFEVITLQNKDQAVSFAYSLKNGEKLEFLAARYPIKVDVMQTSGSGRLRKEIEDAVFPLAIGGVSDPVEIGGVYYVFRILSITPSRQQTLSEVQPKIYAHLFNKKMQEEMRKWIDEVKKKSYIKTYQD
ncbi:MAG: peptidyl-prolyl cis-trans isomerase [Candidatus Omnitrophica bacterium]|nr:peptidyl-prolyl cis-trans isomerase [Candidatus Omnitrophota bacterium]